MPSVSYRHFTGRSAENYQRYFVPLIATLVSKDLLLAAALLPGERVLDVACGTGHVSRAAATLATIEGRDFPGRESTQPNSTTAAQLAARHDDLANHWSAMVSEYTAEGLLGDTIIDELCDPPESFQLHGIVAHVLTYSAHRRKLARTMLAHHGVQTRTGDPLDWMRGN